MKIPGGIYLFLIVFAIGLGELYVVRKAYAAKLVKPNPTGEYVYEPGDRFFATVSINGHSTRMLYDTAALITYINKALADRIGLRGRPVGTVGNRNMSGNPDDPLYSVRLTLGDDNNKRTITTEIAVGNAQLLSQADLVKARLVPVISGSSIRLVPEGTSIVAAARTPVELEYESAEGRGRNMPFITIKMNGKPLTVRVDTGTPKTRITTDDADRLNIRPTAYLEGVPFADVTMVVGDGDPFTTNVRIGDTFAGYGSIIGFIDLRKSGYSQIWGDEPQLVPTGRRITV